MTKTEKLSVVIDKILESRLTGKTVQRQQILKACKEAGLAFVNWPHVDNDTFEQHKGSVELIEVE